MTDQHDGINIIRDCLRVGGYYSSDDVTIEEGKSKDGRINALLQVIPTELTAKRYPDFLLHIKEMPQFLIVVESRSGRGAAEKSPNEDGTMLYSAALAQAYDVLTITVRETHDGQYRIEHFLQRCQDRFYRRMFGNRLLSVKEYLDGVRCAPKEERPISAKLIVGAPGRREDTVHALVRMELFLMVPKFAHRFMDRRGIRMVRRKGSDDIA